MCRVNQLRRIAGRQLKDYCGAIGVLLMPSDFASLLRAITQPSLQLQIISGQPFLVVSIKQQLLLFLKEFTVHIACSGLDESQDGTLKIAIVLFLFYIFSRF